MELREELKLNSTRLDESLYHEQQYLSIKTQYNQLEQQNNQLEGTQRQIMEEGDRQRMELQEENEKLRKIIDNQGSTSAKENLTGRIQLLDNEGIVYKKFCEFYTFFST